MAATTWRSVVWEAVQDLDAEHAPYGEDDRLCQTCSGGYPCTSRLVADDLRALLAPDNGRDANSLRSVETPDENGRSDP